MSPGGHPCRYAILPVALLVVLPGILPLAFAMALSFGSRLAAPFDTLLERGVVGRP